MWTAKDSVVSDQSAELKQAARQAAEWIHDADVLVFATGAGMGVDSGIGTFRGVNAGS
jgi:hypothetical protein